MYDEKNNNDKEWLLKCDFGYCYYQENKMTVPKTDSGR
jgi:hypothetical protein